MSKDIFWASIICHSNPPMTLFSYNIDYNDFYYDGQLMEEHDWW